MKKQLVLYITILFIFSISYIPNTMSISRKERTRMLNIYKEELKEVERERQTLMKKKPIGIGPQRRHKKDLVILNRRRNELRTKINKMR